MRLRRLVFPALAAGVFLSFTWSFLLAQGLSPSSGQAIVPVQSPDAPAGKLLVRRSPIVELVERVKASVVNIHSERIVQGSSTQEFLALAPSQSRISGMGTGIIIDHRGYIVTNHHVVEDVNFIRVKLADGTSCNAQVVARIHEQDLALLKIDVSKKLQVMPLGTAQDLMVGETVIAIGNAYGYEHTVSSGIVSAIKRDVSLNKEISYKSLIQTDSPINPGNSGGPLLNVNGELVGVNVAIRAGAQCIGFAIPVDTMIRVVSDMLKTRHRQQFYDGLSVRDVLESTPEGMVRSVVVDRVEPGTPAALASIQKGDVIVRFGDLPVLCSFDVDRALMDHRPNDRLAIVVKRQSQESKAELVLQSTDRTKTNVAEIIWRKLGITTQPTGLESVSRVSRELRGGLEIVQINPTGPAARSGMKKGDILVGLSSSPPYETVKIDDVAYVLTSPELRLPLTYYVVRDQKVQEGSCRQLD